MKMNWMKQILLPIVLIALIISTMWTYQSIRPRQSADQAQEVTLSIIPDYQITSGISLLVWPKGTVFEQGMASYFYAAKPSVSISPSIKINGLEQGFLSGTIQSEITLQAVDDKAQIYWSYRLSETKEQPFNLSQDVPEQEDNDLFVSDEIILDVGLVYDQITQISNELMFQNGVFQLIVSSKVNVTGTVNGNKIEKYMVQILPMTLQQANFSIPKTQDIISQHSFNNNVDNQSFQQSTVARIQDNLLLVIINLTLAFVFILLILRRNSNKSKSDKEYKRFKEWITEGSVDVKDRLKINILSLEGLVDLAIDLDRRVIYDSRINNYYVLTEDIIYVYDSKRSLAILDNKQQLGKLLIERGLLLPEQLEMGLYYQRKSGRRLGENIVALGFIDETTLYSTLAKQQEIDYYELDSRKEYLYTEWLEIMSLQKARAMMTLPLGVRADGRWVIACSEASREGIQDALEELFGKEIYLVSARPSAIHEILERIDTQLNMKENINSKTKESILAPFERLTQEEWKRFRDSYYRGKLLQGLLVKALGYADSAILSQTPEQESVLSWMVHKNIINGEIANLIKGLDEVIENMEWKSRQDKQIPSLLNLLMQANYFTKDTVEWVEREIALQQLPIDQLVCSNYLASEETIKNASFLLETVESLLTKSEMDQ